MKTVNLKISDLISLLTRALTGQGLKDELAIQIAQEFIIAELSGVKTHGIGKLISLNFGNPDAEPTYNCNGSVLSVDGNGANGFSLFSEIAERIVEIAKKNGISICFARNFSRYSSLYPYTTTVADNGLIGILSNSAGPAAVAPYGSYDPITGTNPICVSFPMVGDNPSHTIDFSTSEVVWGEVRQAMLEKRDLKEECFYNESGNFANQPEEVHSVRSFGGAKGWALNLILEVLAGSIAAGKSGLEVESEFDCGAFFIAIDPSFLGFDLDISSCSIEALFSSIRNSRPLEEGENVRVPGDKVRGIFDLDSCMNDDYQLSSNIQDTLEKMASGENAAELASNNLFN